jgi:Family of unknown function (DUF6157)
MLEIINTFIQVAPDSTATKAVIPEARDDKKTIQVIQYELLSAKPYSLTLQDLIFEVFVKRNQISSTDLELHKTTIWTELFAKDHPCMRASMLPKKYGWGVHYDVAGKIGLVKASRKSNLPCAVNEPKPPKINNAFGGLWRK